VTSKIVLPALLVLANSAAAQEQAVFRVDTRLVEVYATVRDNHGRYMDGLTRDRFQVLDNGVPQTVTAFESNSSRFTCAILIDTTGSMAGVLPVVKNSVTHLIDELRDEDSVGVFSFNTRLNQLQDFTQNKAAAKQAVLRTRAAGATALFDAIAELAYQIAPRNGKKAIVVFTDGADNSSLLNAQAAVKRAKKAGVPVYAIAEGEALGSKSLLDELKDVAEMTGAQSYLAHKASDIVNIFARISEDLQHTYMLAFQPAPNPVPKWRTIQLTVSGLKEPKIRAKEGYLPE
jgi:Ca-activated chloride channel homolog